jgi:hypothetical protein
MDLGGCSVLFPEPWPCAGKKCVSVHICAKPIKITGFGSSWFGIHKVWTLPRNKIFRKNQKKKMCLEGEVWIPDLTVILG